MGEKENDEVNHPSHYTAYKGIEIIELTEQMNFNRGNAVKYISRAGLKDPDREIQDLEKAVWYINREIVRIKSERSVSHAVEFGPNREVDFTDPSSLIGTLWIELGTEAEYWVSEVSISRGGRVVINFISVESDSNMNYNFSDFKNLVLQRKYIRRFVSS